MKNLLSYLIFATLLAISFLILSCKSDKRKVDMPNYNQPVQFTYLALGDSYTIGQSVVENERFPQQLVKLLEDKNFVNKDLRVVARTGWTTGELIASIEADKPDNTYSMVSLLIGVNNQYRGLDTAGYRQQFDQLLQTAISFAGGEASRVLVLSIPDYGVTPFAASMDTAKIAREIDLFNHINYSETKKTQANYFDITTISRLVATDPDLIAADGLHPSGKMYAQWVEKLLPDAEKILSRKY